MDFPFPIVDPHIHQWDLRQTPRILSWPRRLLGWNPWLYHKALLLGAKARDRACIGRFDYVAWDYLPEQYSRDVGSLPIRQVVHVEAEWHDHSSLGAAAETAWLETLFDGMLGPQLGGIVAYADLASPQLGQLLAAHRAASNKLRGIRQMLAFDTDPGIRSFCQHQGLTEEANWRRGLEQLQPWGLSFDVFVFHHQLDEVQALAQAFPQQQFILDHMGMPLGLGGPFASYGHHATERETIRKTWQAGLAKLAACPNVAVKLSGFFMPFLGWGYEKRAMPPSAGELSDAFEPACRYVLEQFGTERCMFASNFPMDKVSLSLQALYELYATTVRDLPLAEQRKLFHDNAQRIYGLASSDQ